MFTTCLLSDIRSGKCGRAPSCTETKDGKGGEGMRGRELQI